MVQKNYNIREFYKTRLGKMTGRLLRVHIRRLWPELKNRRVVGIGYATPFMKYYLDHAERVVAMKTTGVGISPWPDDGLNLAAFVHEDELPLETASIDRILMVHCLENAENILDTLRESNRVLEANGRLLVIVPNRTGFWSRRDHTPFGQGVPFSVAQLHEILNETGFSIENVAHGLFTPPFQSRFFISLSPAFERFGSRFLGAFCGGVHVVEARKDVYAGIKADPSKGHKRRLVQAEPTA